MGRFNTVLLKAVGPVQGAGDARSTYMDNDDIRPLALKNRTWTHWTYFWFWFSALSSVGSWYASSAAQASGLSMWEAWGTNLAGHLILAVVAYYNGRPGAVYSVGYPILCRASFGVYGAWWPVFNRGAIAIVWNGVNAVQGGQCVYTMLHAIFPGITKLPNVMGSGSALDSGGLIGFFLFWIATCLFLVLPVPKMKNYVYTKLIVFVVSAVAMLAWCLTLAGGLGPVASQPSTVHGSAKAWLIVKFVILGAAGSATFASNAADFQRYAKRPSDTFWGNIVGYPMAGLIVTLVGNIVAASSTRIFGKMVWNPLTMLDMIQEENYSAGNRAGCFFIALMFAYSAVFSSIFENSLSAGNDLAALLPRWISVQRGMYLCQVVSVIIQPWYLLSSASIFISFLSSYQVFLSSITGVLLANYYLVARGSFQVPDLYTGDRRGAYYYLYGWNIRAYVAYLLGLAPNFYGFLHAMGVKANTGVVRFYYFAYPVGIIVPMLIFWAASYFFPPAIMHPINEWHEPRDYIRPEEEIEAAESPEGDASASYPEVDEKGATAEVFKIAG